MSEDEHPYSLAYESNGIVYVSGAASIDYTTHLPVPGRREALDAALAAVETRLAGVGLTIENIVKMTYFVTDLSLRDEANEQVVERFNPPRPPVPAFK